MSNPKKIEVTLKGGWRGYYPGQDGTPTEGRLNQGIQTVEDPAFIAFLETQSWVVMLLGNVPEAPQAIPQEEANADKPEVPQPTARTKGKGGK